MAKCFSGYLMQDSACSAGSSQVPEASSPKAASLQLAEVAGFSVRWNGRAVSKEEEVSKQCINKEGAQLQKRDGAGESGRGPTSGNHKSSYREKTSTGKRTASCIGRKTNNEEPQQHCKLSNMVLRLAQLDDTRTTIIRRVAAPLECSKAATWSVGLEVVCTGGLRRAANCIRKGCQGLALTEKGEGWWRHLDTRGAIFACEGASGGPPVAEKGEECQGLVLTEEGRLQVGKWQEKESYEREPPVMRSWLRPTEAGRVQIGGLQSIEFFVALYVEKGGHQGPSYKQGRDAV
ncbi:hypothetical protein GOP47_0015898 [Adiantum capillus-veneris]|uniref:Uncharacterized protein n=1 Tax=Adiantum capillus-veneris TaxID=13818 RepID=A0A9D4ULB8_ADICA|nr:hypothetical protein GOP47_0015898 [Adiantum capillus-veneris]